MRLAALLLLLGSPLAAEPFVAAWMAACVADGARAFGGARGALPPGEQRLRDPTTYCRDRATKICRFAPDPTGCRMTLDAGATPGDNGAEGEQR